MDIESGGWRHDRVSDAQARNAPGEGVLQAFVEFPAARCSAA
jgi:hypothetical protein